MFYENNIDSFYQSIYFVTFFKPCVLQTVSRHHGREPDIIILSPAYSHGYLGHNIVCLNLFNLTMDIITYTSFHEATSNAK